jgi:hypothetical protein
MVRPEPLVIAPVKLHQLAQALTAAVGVDADGTCDGQASSRPIWISHRRKVS